MINTNEPMILLNGDYKDIIKDIPNKSVDCVITDAPYLVGRKTNFHTMKGRGGTVGMMFGEWDTQEEQGSIQELLEPLFKEIPRILKENGNVVIFNDWKNLSIIVDLMIDNHIIPKRCLVIHKSNPAPFNMKVMFVNDVEFAIWGGV